MLSSISWGTYFLVVILLLVVYYSFVIWKFYLIEVKRFFVFKGQSSSKLAILDVTAKNNEDSPITSQTLQTGLFDNDTYSFEQPPVEEETVAQVKELTNSIQRIVVEASEKNFIKEEFFLSLQLQLKHYSFLKGSPTMAAVNNLIASECEKHGYIRLSAEERMSLWNE